MAIKENQLTNVADISSNDKVRLVTNGGASANGTMENLGEFLLEHYSGTQLAGSYQTIKYAFRYLQDQAYLGQGFAVCNTAAATTAKTASLSDYKKITGGIVSVYFYYNVPASATLNINSAGAYPIYYANSLITDGIINAGEIASFVFDGYRYRLISKDKTLVVATGTTANWKYIKYSDGRVDLSTTLSLSAAEGSQWVSGQPFYYQDTNISLPTGMLTETPSDIVATSGNTQWWIFGVWASNSNTLRARLVKIVSSAQAAVVRVRVIGKWR